MGWLWDRKSAGWLLALSFCLLLTACRAPSSGAPRLLIDGRPAQSPPQTDAEGVRVYITVDGAQVAALPFGEAHVVTVRQPGVGENVVRLTGSAVYMESADCENQDCVHMGEVTPENLELRVMGGFIVCLPHRVSVEVRAP